MTYEEKYEQLDQLWPNKRTLDIKAQEMQAVQKYLQDDTVWQEFVSSLEVLISDTKRSKLPDLRVLIAKTAEAPVVINTIPVTVATQEPQNQEAEKVFEEIWQVWPQNIEYPERKERALQALISKVGTKTLENIKTASLAYARECNDPNNAIVYTKGLRNFLNDDEMFEDWVYRGSETKGEPDYGPAFEVVWKMYPKFKGKDTVKAKKEAAILYRRFINDSNRIEFYCAVLDYFHERRGAAFNDSAGVVEYTKNMANFYKDWQRQGGLWERIVWFLILPLKEGLESRGIKHWMYLEGDTFSGAVALAAKKKKSVVETCTCVVEKVYELMGKPVDYSIVGEVVDKVKKETSDVPSNIKEILEVI